MQRNQYWLSALKDHLILENSKLIQMRSTWAPEGVCSSICLEAAHVSLLTLLLRGLTGKEEVRYGVLSD